MKYVPLGDDSDVLDTIFFDGDHQREERARNIQWVFKDGENLFDRLEGLEPLHADWHAKVNLYNVRICIYIYSP